MQKIHKSVSKDQSGTMDPDQEEVRLLYKKPRLLNKKFEKQFTKSASKVTLRSWFDDCAIFPPYDLRLNKVHVLLSNYIFMLRSYNKLFALPYVNLFCGKSSDLGQ